MPFEGAFTLSVWLKAQDVNGSASTILSKDGLQGMNLFDLQKDAGSGGVVFSFFGDGNSTSFDLNSSGPVLKQDEWVHLAFVFDGNASLSMYANAVQIAQSNGLVISGMPLDQRYSNLKLGSAFDPFDGLVDDLRVYEHALDTTDLSQIFGQGGGDFNQLELIGAGTTKIVASQSGSDSYAQAVPVTNYLTVVKVPQSISFAPILDHSVGDFPFMLDANATSGLPVSFSTSDPTRAVVNGGQVQILVRVK